MQRLLDLVRPANTFDLGRPTYEDTLAFAHETRDRARASLLKRSSLLASSTSSLTTSSDTWGGQ